MCQPRPRRLVDVVGQAGVVADLQTCIDAARITGEAVGHVLLAGPPGLGKTTIARLIACELGVGLHPAAGASIGSTQDLINLLVGADDRDVVLIDEIHALPPGLVEGIYQAMEDRQVTVMLAQGIMTRAVTLELGPFTLIGATTDAGLLPEAFLSRFVERHRLSFYEPRELAAIIEKAAPDLGVGIEREAAARLAAVCRGTPRRGIMLLRKLRRQAIVEDRSTIDALHVSRMLDRMGIDERGLGPLDRQYLEILTSGGGPVGVGRAASLLGTDARTLEREHEPYLMHLGLIAVTPRGRVAVDADRRRQRAA